MRNREKLLVVSDLPDKNDECVFSKRTLRRVSCCGALSSLLTLVVFFFYPRVPDVQLAGVKPDLANVKFALQPPTFYYSFRIDLDVVNWNYVSIAVKRAQAEAYYQGIKIGSGLNYKNHRFPKLAFTQTEVGPVYLEWQTFQSLNVLSGIVQDCTVNNTLVVDLGIAVELDFLLLSGYTTTINTSVELACFTK